MTFQRRQLLQSAGAGALLAALGQRAFAQAQLESTKIITGFAAGGTSDTICRRVAQKLQGDFAKAAVVENRTGAGGQIAIQAVRSAAPDGSTILQTPTSMLTIYPHIYKKLAYDPVADLTPVSPRSPWAASSTSASPSAPRCRPTSRPSPSSWPGPRPTKRAPTSARRPPAPRRTSWVRCWASTAAST